MLRRVASLPARSPVLRILIPAILALTFLSLRAAAPARAQPVERIGVVPQLLAALSRGDVDAQLALLTDDASLISGPVCIPQSPCQGAGLRPALEGNVPLHTSITVVSAEVIGSAVVGHWEVRNDRLSAAGIDHLTEAYFAQIPQDRVSLLVSTYDLSDAGTAAVVRGQ